MTGHVEPLAGSRLSVLLQQPEQYCSTDAVCIRRTLEEALGGLVKWRLLLLLCERAC